MKRTIINIIIIGFLIVLTSVSCEKEYDSLGLFTEEVLVNEHGQFILPVNFGEFNKAPNTKVTQGSTYYFNFDPSMLDVSGVVQKEVKPGIIYTETPLKGVLYCRTTSDYICSESDKGNIVQAKIFHIKKEFCLKDSLSERLITMIPTAEYYASDKDFSYLDMPGFTGTVITSSIEGEPIDVWGMNNGRIGVGKFLKDDVDSVFAKLEFYESPDQVVYEGTLTKSDPADTLDACYVVASYTIKHNVSPIIFTDFIFDPIENTPPDPGLQLPSGGLLEEEEGTIYYTATVNTKFCNSENASNSLLCAKNSELELEAKSSESDSCIFFCWKIGGKVHTHEPSFVITMDKSYTFNAIYHSSDNKACYELAKTVSDAAFIYKMDSLRMVMDRTQKETGLAKGSNGRYYRFTNGSELSIEVNFETSVDYDYLYHSHPSGFCLPSGQDLLILFGMVGGQRINDYNLFRFGIVTQNDIMALKVNDSIAFVNFIGSIYSEFQGDADRAAIHIQENNICPIIEQMEVYNKNICLQEIVPLFNSMGLGVYYSSREQSGEVKWKYVSVGNGNTIDYSECYNK